MLRSALAAVVVGVGVFAGGVAAAWTDPAGRVIFDTPRGWAVQQENAPPDMSYVIAATGAAECHVVVQPNGLGDRTRDDIRAGANNDAAYDNAAWTRILNALLAPVFPGNSANVMSTSKDESGPWIVRRAEVQGSERMVRVTMQSRPGVDMLSACMTFDGAPPNNTFDAFERSIRHPNDATWEAAPATEAAPAPAQ